MIAFVKKLWDRIFNRHFDSSALIHAQEPRGESDHQLFTPITIDEYFMGRREKYPDEYNFEIEAHAKDLLWRVNGLLQVLGIKEKILVTSGWRPSAVNKKVGGATRSAHLVGMAIDISDRDKRIAEAILKNVTQLWVWGLWCENPEQTKTWVHLQSRPTQSMIFNP